ncbi:MAG TPA: PCYCGC motif-containing (lipo)protein [Gemmatimonadaceae bacterium]
MSTPSPLTRRALLATIARACAATGLALALGDFVAPSRLAHAATAPAGKHPDPRPGIDASRIPPAEKVREHGDNALAAFDEARHIPQILDGIRCHCGCAEDPDMRSLLTCYEGDDAMAMLCHICQGQARLAYKLHQRGRTLDQIRAAIDARYD